MSIPYRTRRVLNRVGIVGGALGVVGMMYMPDFPATDYITAAAVGIVSGLAATGADQVVKQMKKEGE